jgi:allophanate hydrolase subunit 1
MQDLTPGSGLAIEQLDSPVPAGQYPGSMSATASAVLDRAPASAGKPSITYRQAGDRAILVEYGEMEFDLRLNFFVIAVDAALREQPPEGFVEAAPGFRSILVSYEPDGLDARGLVAHLGALHDAMPAQRELELPSRLIRLPIAFDDSQSTQAVERYIHSIRKDAPNCEGGNNIDYVVSYNGLASRDEVYESVLATEQWAAFIGFFPGLPFMFPLDPRHVLVAPKYNPTRTWTAEGAFGLGGPCFAIYPVESAGGYQLLGRTLPIYDVQARNAAFRENPLLLRAGDRLTFHRVEEDELLSLWEDVRSDRYRYEIDDGSFDVGAYLEWTAQVEPEAAERRAHLEQGAAATEVP